MNNKYYIIYEVKGFPGIQKVGPYSEAEVYFQFNDISSYEGVENTLVIKTDENEEK